MTTFTVYWRDGCKTEMEGADVSEVMNSICPSRNRIHAIDFVVVGPDNSYEYNFTTRNWVHKSLTTTPLPI